MRKRSRTAATRPGAASGRQSNYSVYVVELSRTGAGASGQSFYVGETALTPDERYEKHLAGGRTSAAIVRRYGVGLRPDLVAGQGPFRTRTEAIAAEARIAARLRGQGHQVFGGQGRSFSLRRPRSGGVG